MSVALLEQGNTQSVEQRKVPRYTGEILLRTRPKTYRRIVDLLSSGESTLNIAALCKVSRNTIDAISERQATRIEQRKNEMALMLTDVGHIGAARMMDKVGKASLRDASIATGIAIQRTLELLGQSVTTQVAVVNMPSDTDREERRALHDKLDAIAQRLSTQD